MTTLSDSPASSALGKWIIYALLSVVLTLLMIQHAQLYGKLLTGPVDDDALYYYDGLNRWTILQTQGVEPLLRDIVVHPPHAPTSTLMCGLSFAIFGPHDWAPLALNGVVIFALLTMLEKLTPQLSHLQRVPLIALALCIPMTHTLITEARPDSVQGLVMAFGLLLLLRQPMHEQSRWQLMQVGTLGALALLLKPTFFPFTIFAFGLAFLAQAAAAPLLLNRPASEPWRRMGWICLPVLLFAVPWYIIVGQHIITYIHTNVFSPMAKLWHFQHTPWQQAMFFIIGDSGYWMFGRHLLIIVPLMLLGLVTAFRSEDRKHRICAVMIVIVLFTAYLFPTLNKTKNQFFASTFHFMSLMLACMSMSAFYERQRPTDDTSPGARSWLRQKLLRPALIPFVLILPASILLWSYPRQLGSPTDPRVVHGNAIERQIVQLIEQNSDVPAQRPRVFYTTSGAPVQFMLLRYRALQRGWEPIADDLHRYNDLPRFAEKLAAADFIVASQSGGVIARDRLPSGTIQDELLEMARRLPDKRLLAKLPEANGRHYYIFHRPGPFGGWDSVEGLLPIEGPYPQLELPTLRWGTAPATVITINVAKQESRSLEWTATGPIPGQRMTITLNGKTEAIEPIAATRSGVIRLNLRPGKNRIELYYQNAETSAADGHARAIRFERLRLVR